MNSVDDTSVSLQSFSKQQDDRPCLLVVVLDTNPAAWAALKDVLPLKEAIASLLVFINSHLAFRNSNSIAVIAAHTDSAKFLYPVKGAVDQGVERISNEASMYRLFREVNDTVLDQLDMLLAGVTEDSMKESTSAVAGAFSLALTYANKVQELSEETTEARIMLVSVSGDISSQYVPTMNTIFAAQKKKIPIDVCKLTGDTVLLQQACDSTNGVYMKLEHPRGLIHYLMTSYLLDPSLRSHVVLQSDKDVDFRAACFLTKQVVDIAYVCSVCLCIISFIPQRNACPMCGTVYDQESLAKLTKKPYVKKKTKKKRKLDSGVLCYH